MVHVYTGNGKGKTTAAIGLAVRALGAGQCVFFGQFIKKGTFSEITALQKFCDKITICQYGSGSFITSQPCKKEITLAKKGWSEIMSAIQSGRYSVVVADEALCAVSVGVLCEDDILDLINTAHHCDIEFIITGRGATEKIIKHADLVSDICEIKHYYNKDTPARVGIEF